MKIVAECVGCKNKREIMAGEVAPDEVPICDKCLMPMVVKSVKVR